MIAFEAVKKEIRILGLDACNSMVIVGAIVRGALYLDGVVVFSKRISSGRLAREIMETKYFPELRIIMLHDPNGELDSESIRRNTRLALIRAPPVKRGKVRGPINQRPRQSQPRHAAGLDQATLERVLELTQAKGRLPEPLRIAHLLAKIHVFRRK